MAAAKVVRLDLAVQIVPLVQPWFIRIPPALGTVGVAEVRHPVEKARARAGNARHAWSLRDAPVDQAAHVAAVRILEGSAPFCEILRIMFSAKDGTANGGKTYLRQGA